MDQESDDGLDSADAQAWFQHDVKPETPGEIGVYAAEPPRGMSNPPRSAKIRRELLQDILANGTELEGPEWPPRIRLPRSASRSVPSSPSVSATNFFSPASTASSFHRTALSRMAVSQSYIANMRRGLISASSSMPSHLGSTGGSTSSHTQKRSSSAPVWHNYAYNTQKMQPLDRRKALRSGAHGDGNEQRSVRFFDESKIEVVSTAGKTGSGLEVPGRGNSGAAEYIKTPSHAKALEQARRQSLEPSAAGKRLSVDAPGVTKRTKDAKPDKSTDTSQDGSKKGPPQEIEESMIDDKMRVLRGCSQLHRAAVSDRFRFGADSSAGSPMVLGCTSANQANPGVWASDAAFLNKFHNSAIRIVDPSGLQVLPQPKKRKKKKNKDDEEALEVSESSVFVARYPIDNALKSLRRLRKKSFPEEPEIVYKETAEEKARKAASSLKANLGLSLLSGVRDKNADEAAATAYAVAASGYED